MKWIISPFVGESDRVLDKIEDRSWGPTIAVLITLLVIAWAFV